jgi:lipooligosaccharide transport system permease protein
MRRALAVLEYHLVCYRRTWRGTTLGSFVLPVLIVLGFGIGVGHYVDAGGQLGHVRYLDYIVPGQVAIGAMNLAFFDSTFPVLGRFQWVRTYHGMVAAPLRVVDVLGGELLFIIVRLGLATAVFLLVTTVFGAVHSPWALVVPVICALLGMAIATPVHAFAALVDSDSYFMLLLRFILIPAALFSGAYFPITALPELLRWLAYALPLWHAVDLARAATLPGVHLSGPVVVGHVAYLGLWAAVGFWLAMRFYRRRLVV